MSSVTVGDRYEITAVYVRKQHNVVVPQNENSHCMKNPFFPRAKSVQRFTDRPKADKAMLSEEFTIRKRQSDKFVVRCKSGFKAELKNKHWDMFKLPKPCQSVNNSTSKGGDSRASDDSKNHLQDSEDKSAGTIVPVTGQKEELKLESWPSSFEDEILHIQAGIEYKKKLTPEVLRNFEVIRRLPLLTGDEVRSKIVRLPRRSLKATDKTLVVDLDQTLVFSSDQLPANAEGASGSTWYKITYTSVNDSRGVLTKYVRVRPGAEQLLAELHPLYEIVVYTSAEQNYAETVVEKLLDRSCRYVDHVLSRESCMRMGEYYIKDLRVIGDRELANLVVLDSSLVSFCNQLDNGIFVVPYRGDDKDMALVPLVKTLKDVANTADVRRHLRCMFFLSDLYRMYLKEQSGNKLRPNAV